jgi:hypothetical protein
VQLQNLPKRALSDPEGTLAQLLARADGIVAGAIDPMNNPAWPISIKAAISGSLRALFRAPEGWVFVSVDLSAIEARVLAVIAGQHNVVEEFQRNEDVYTKTAARLGSDNRDLGKLLVLSCGYGASGRVVHNKSAGYGVTLSLDEASDFTRRWREANGAIVSFWHDLFDTLCFVIEMPVDQPPVEFHSLNIWRTSEILIIQLPSGRCLKYHDPVVESDELGRPQITVKLPRDGEKFLPGSLWYGAATENIIQAIAFDVMAEAMLRLHDDGVFVVATVHDEIVALAPVEDAEAIRDHMIRVMSKAPAWMPDLPLSAEGFINQRFVRPAKPLHAPLAPSAAERWFACPGSVAAVQALPEAPETAYAAEGTEAHRIFAACLERGTDPIEFSTDFMLVQPLRAALAIARDVIAGRKFKVEVRLNPVPGIGAVWGTCDIIIFDEADRVVAIIDLKFGAGVTVEPDALQLQLYALLAAQQYGCTFDGIELHIIQPRRQHERGPHRVHHISIVELTDLYTRLQKAVQATEDPAAPRIPGDHCRFCAARESCPEARSAARPARPLVNPFIGRRFA